MAKIMVLQYASEMINELRFIKLSNLSLANLLYIMLFDSINIEKGRWPLSCH